MDRDFHYYLTFFVCRASGFSHGECAIMAYSNQYIDDNVSSYRVRLKNNVIYRNSISYTRKIFNINTEVLVMMPLHFLPGDMNSPQVRRIDGKKSPINVTSGSYNARFLFRKALQTGNLYKTGIMMHTFQDTWAHQNFTGIWDDWNATKKSPVIPDIGHAEEGNVVDMFNAKWHDPRLPAPYDRVDNSKRFLECARVLFRFLTRDKKRVPSCTWKEVREGIHQAIKGTTPENIRARCRNFQQLYEDRFLQKMPFYDKREWFDLAVKRKRMTYVARRGFPQSHWYCFQREMKEHKLEVLSYFYQKK